MAKKSFAVIGLGQFGCSIVEELSRLGADILALDKDEESVNRVSKIVPTCFVADSTNEEALKELGVKDVDTAIVAYGNNKEASVLTTVLLREFGVKNIIVRVDNDYYVPIMKKLGATEVITPQKAAGIALANRLGSSDYKDFYKIDQRYSVVSIIINSSFIPITLTKLNSKNNYGVNIVLISRKGKSFVPGGTDSLLPEDTIYVVGTNNDVKNFRTDINGNKKKLYKETK